MVRAPPCSKTGHVILHASKTYVPIEFNVDLCCLRNMEIKVKEFLNKPVFLEICRSNTTEL